MLIKFDDPGELNPNDKTNNCSVNTIRVLSNAITAYAEGSHLVWMPLPLIKRLIELDCFNSYQQRALFQLQQYSREAKNLSEELKYYIHITFDDEDVCVFAENHLKLSYQSMLESCLWQPLPLLVENIDDAELYEISAKSILVHIKSSNIYNINLDHQNGGGTTTFDLFARLISKEKLTLCILDNDKNHPDDKLGGTADRFSDHFNGDNTKYLIKVLESREIENIIPITIINEIALKHHLNIPDKFYVLTSSGFRTYFDHKDGLYTEQALKYDEDCNNIYWGKLPKAIKETWICEPLPAGIAKKALDYMKKKTPHKMLEVTKPDEDKEWLDIGRLVASWGLCNKRIVK